MEQRGGGVGLSDTAHIDSNSQTLGTTRSQLA